MTYTFFGLFVYVITQLWEILIATFGGIFALIGIVISFIGDVVLLIVNLGGFITWLLPACLLPLYYVSVVIIFVKWLITVLPIGGIFK